MLYVARPLPQVARRHVPPTTVRTPIVPQAACASLLLTLLRRNRDIAVETRRYLLLLLFLFPFFPSYSSSSRRESRKFVGNSGSRSCVRSDRRRRVYDRMCEPANVVFVTNRPRPRPRRSSSKKFILITGFAIADIDTVVSARSLYFMHVR